MHGNPHARSDDDVDPSSASASKGAALWLGLPTARGYFDPSTLSLEDQRRFVDLRGARRRTDFGVSRALLAFAAVGATTRSLAHSAEHAALLVASTGCQVGVDLEFHRPRDVLRLARFAFDEREATAVATAPEQARPRLFYTLWTLKESFAKALQLELVDALRHCVFWKEGGAWRGQVPTTLAWSAAVFQPRPHLFLAAASIGETELPKLQQWEWPPEQRADWPLIACAGAPAAADTVQTASSASAAPAGLLSDAPPES